MHSRGDVLLPFAAELYYFRICRLWVGEAAIETQAHAEPAPPRFILRHNGIAGRARLQVSGLRGNQSLCVQIECVRREQGIRAISASQITGTILIHYDPDRRLDDIVGYLEVAIDHAPDASTSPEAAAIRPPRSSRRSL